MKCLGEAWQLEADEVDRVQRGEHVKFLEVSW